MVLPLFTLGTLALRTLRKPIANTFKQQTLHSPRVRHFITGVAQETRWKLAYTNVMVLPLFKLGTLAVRTLSKPIANRLKQQTVHHPRFRQFIIGIAQANHRFTTTVQRRIYNHATDVEIRPLNEERAVQLASNMIGEMFIFLVAGALVVFEVQRSAKSEAKKEEKRKQELEELRKRDEALSKEVELLRLKIAELEQLSKGRGISGLFNFKFPIPRAEIRAEAPQT